MGIKKSHYTEKKVKQGVDIRGIYHELHHLEAAWLTEGGIDWMKT